MNSQNLFGTPRPGALVVRLEDASQVGEARRAAVQRAESLGFDETLAGKVGIAATEAAGNLLKHAQQGQLVISSVELRGVVGLELLAIDRGPGISNLARCLEDGYSTAGTPGSGLGAITRLADEFDVFSAKGSGTAMLARFWLGRLAPLVVPVGVVGAVSIPYPGEEYCGDLWTAHQVPGRTLLMVSDGLGHGWSAAEAATAASRSFHANTRLRPAAILEAAHHALRSTRGAAMSVAEIDYDREEVRYAGVGNICGVITSAQGRTNLVSHNGIVGHQARKFQEFVYPLPPDSVVVLHSDGLTAHWSLADYPGLAARDPALISGVLCRDHSRGRDDVTVATAKWPVSA